MQPVPVSQFVPTKPASQKQTPVAQSPLLLHPLLDPSGAQSEATAYENCII